MVVWQRIRWAIAGVVLGGVISGLPMSPVAQSSLRAQSLQSVPVRVDRWLTIQSQSGKVTYLSGQTTKPARVGDRLQAVGDGISTGPGAKVVLAVDTGIGTISVDENTVLRIQTLQIAPDNGRITRLQVPAGRVRLQIRPFTHVGSRLEIQTPSGWSGVRGTEFGVSVQPSGKTGLATLRGRVAATAQGQEVLVSGGFQNFTLPGEPPSQPQPLTNDTTLRSSVERMIDNGVRKIRFVGQVNPVNQVVVDGVAQSTDRQGLFSVERLVPANLKIQVTVITPLGRRQTYELAFP